MDQIDTETYKYVTTKEDEMCFLLSSFLCWTVEGVIIT